MNTQTDWTNRHHVAGNIHRIAVCWSFSVLRFIVCGTILALVMTACSSPSSTSQPPAPAPQPCSVLDQEPTISQVKQGEITIDGNVAEWAAREWLAACTSRLGSPLAPSPDLDENIFIIHGAKDLAVPIGDTRKAVEKLQAMQANVEYIELPEGGHGGDLDSILEIISWVKKYSD